MKFVVFGTDGRVGVIEEDRIIDLNRADSRLPSRLDAFIDGGAEALDGARRVLGKPAAEAVVKLDSVALHAPWAGRRLAMMGGNYADHLAGMSNNLLGIPMTAEQAGAEMRKRGQWGFWKVLQEVAGDGDEVPYPERTKYLDYEAEVAVVIGKQGKNVRAAEFRDYVWGVTLVNDWSIRDNMGAPGVVSYNMAKNFDRSCSVGPCIAVGEAEFDDVDVETKVNDELRQRFNSKDMIFSFGEALEFLSRDFTFVPGDILSGGTAAGTAADSTKPNPDGSRPTDRFLKHGDIVEISAPKIGVLRNRIV
jgi:2-keto-4-pentenoate hydratase/2-oxohepta-3-ene-1,7-dioic acid hydratase in catechol pathway